MSKKIYVTGLGPGLYEHMTEAAKNSLKDADVIVGYKTYIDLIKDLIGDKEVLSSGMRKEIDRCQDCLDLAEQGKTVTLVSSGDAGVYGMAGIMLEIVEKQDFRRQCGSVYLRRSFDARLLCHQPQRPDDRLGND